jgi:hypothetical protein
MNLRDFALETEKGWRSLKEKIKEKDIADLSLEELQAFVEEMRERMRGKIPMKERLVIEALEGIREGLREIQEELQKIARVLL